MHACLDQVSALRLSRQKQVQTNKLNKIARAHKVNVIDSEKELLNIFFGDNIPKKQNFI